MKTAILLVSFFLSCGSSADQLLKKRVIDAKYAFCNDGSNAVMYVDDRQCTEWVIFFEGGGGCTDISQCITRSEDLNTKILTSSLGSKFPTVEGEDILSCEPNQNEHFHNYCHVLVPYCSSDYWLGNVSREEYSGRNFSFLGEVIMKAAVQNLMGDGLSNATEVVLYGVSAAAVGLLNHLKWIHNQLPGVNLSLILDSGLFVNHNNVYQYLYSKEMSDNMLSSYPLCQQKDEFGVPCCLLPACLLLNGDSAAIPHVRMLFISSMYDSYLLKFALQLAISSLGPRDDAASLMTRSINEVYSYGSSLLSHASLLHFSLPQISFIMPSCTQHNFVVSSDLWNEGGPLKKAFNRSVVLDFAVVNNDIKAGLWDSITIKGKTIQKHIGSWHTSANESIFITDSCKELFCSVGCQEFVKLTSEDFSISMWWEWLIFSFALLLVYGPLCPKLILLVQQKWLFHLQKKYVRGKTSQKLNKQGSLFASVSCNGLTYRVHRDLTCLFKGKQLLSSLAESNACNRISSTASMEDINSSDEIGILPSVSPHGSSSGPNDEKDIIHDVNLYINPGELVAIMGPTGSGKTTLLDVLLGHRAGGITEGNVFVQGIPLNAMKKWFQNNSGYVRQLVIPYYEELTVRENLVLSANMQLPPGTTFEQLLERVEQIIEETNLRSVADFMVGGSSGVGLSGGQKKRLCIALQLVKLPSVIFLDEPTSGLDASASKELLTILNSLTQGGRSILLTIHQPRIEIFHMFHKVVLLSEGQITYFGSPFNALSYFNKTLMDNSIPVKLNDAVSPADALLDILTHKANQSILVDAYRKSGEGRAVEKAVLSARQSFANAPTATHVQNPGFWRRLMSFESRASLRQTWIQVVYIPVVFIIVAILISTVYHPADVGTKIAAVVCLTSCCSSLLMSSMVMGLLIKPLQIFTLEYSDGISKPQDLILHVFIRMAAISALPLTLCMAIIAPVIYQTLNPVTIVFVIMVFLLVNLCWINIFILITSSFPQVTHRISPLVAALGSFFCGFIIPRDEVGPYYRWILYIDPSYYAFSATSVAVFRSWSFCQNDHVECFTESSVAYISLFDLENVVPIYHVIILIAFIIILLLLSMLVLKLRVEYASIQRAMYMVKNALQRKTKSSGNSQVGPTDPEESDAGSSDADNKTPKHRVLHTFRSWGAVHRDCSSEGQRAEHQHDVELSPDDISDDHYEVIDLQQSSQQQRLFEEMLKRKVRMEQAVLSVNQGMGDWLRVDSESNLLMQEAVGYTVPSGKRSAVGEKHNSWSHLTNNSKNSPQFPRKKSFLVNSEDYGFVLPGGMDSDEDSTLL